MAGSKHPFAGGVFAELGESDADNQGRASGNLGKLFYDDDGLLFKLGQNGEASSRVKHAPTVLQLSVASGNSYRRVIANEERQFGGVWDDAVAANTDTDGNDRQFILYRGVALAAPLESGRTHTTVGVDAAVQPNVGADEFAQDAITAANLADVNAQRVGWLVGATIGSGITVIDVLLALSAQ